MPVQLTPELRRLADRQCGIITRRQAASLRLSEDAIDNQLRTGKWQRIHRGVYAISAGAPGREAMMWAAVAAAGPGAALSHQTAAELFGIADRPSPLIHVTVPLACHPEGIFGVVVHRCGRLEAARHPVLLPPRTRVEDTALDLTQLARTFDDAFGILCRVTGRGLTTAAKLRCSLSERGRARWRGDILQALAEIDAGIRSILERRYVHNVERPHGLPDAARQVRLQGGRRSRYLDNLYVPYLVAVELDGQAWHPVEARWNDIHRDNANASAGILTLRFSWADITERPCAVAAEVAGALISRGWTGAPRPCGPGCRLATSS